MRRLSIFVLAILGCTFDASGQGSGSGPGTGSSSEGGDATTGQGPSTTAVPEGSSGGGSSGGSGSSSEGGSAGTSSSTTTPPEPETGTTTESLPMSRSCAEILEKDPAALTGVYTILRTTDDTEVDVHCEMDLDGGGWTLVARSAPDAGGPFGWGVSRGTLGDQTEPYSLDAMGVGLTFDEILVAQREGFATPVERAYAVDVPAGFLEDYPDGPYDSGDARTVLGDCNPADGPTILRQWGYTQSQVSYFFRDIQGPADVTGLFPDELRAYFDDSCNEGGEINHEQGALFVR